MKTASWWRTKGYVPLIATHSGGNAVTAYNIGGQIIVDVTDLGSLQTVTIKTPFAFKVVDVYIRVTKDGQVSTKTITLQNDGLAMSSTMAASTNYGLLRATTLDSTKVDFDSGDDDLVLKSSDHVDGDFMAVISIVPR